MKLKLIIEINDKMAKIICENSIERVINDSIRIAEDHGEEVNSMDWKENKSTVVNLWVRLQDAIFRKFNNLEEQE